MVLLAMPLIMVASTGVSRVALHLLFLQAWIYSAFMAANGGRRIVATGGVCGDCPHGVLYFIAGTNAISLSTLSIHLV